MNIINPYRFSPATGGLLDQYTGASAAYSFRELSTAWAGLDVVELRRTSDSATSGFTAAEIADGTMLTWTQAAGLSGAVVKTWYDQSGNGNDVVQTLNVNQPRVVASGSEVQLGGKLAIDSFSTSKKLLDSGFSGDFSDQSIFCTARSTASGAYRCIVGHTNNSTTTGREIWVGQNNAATAAFGQAAYSGGGSLTFGGDVTSHFLGSITAADGGNITSYVNGSQVDQNTAGTFSGSSSTVLSIGGDNSTSYPWTGEIQEVIIYPSDETSNRTGIETNINAHYSIY